MDRGKGRRKKIWRLRFQSSGKKDPAAADLNCNSTDCDLAPLDVELLFAELNWFYPGSEREHGVRTTGKKKGKGGERKFVFKLRSELLECINSNSRDAFPECTPSSSTC